MRPQSLIGAFSLALLAGPAPAQTAAGSVAAAGAWQVTSVRNDPGMTITALLDDDAAYMGAVVTIGPGSIAWAHGTSNGQGTFEDCPSPAFAPSRDAPGEIAVACGGAPWGPEAALRPLGANALELAWYDGGLLTLTRR